MVAVRNTNPRHDQVSCERLKKDSEAEESAVLSERAATANGDGSQFHRVVSVANLDATQTPAPRCPNSPRDQIASAIGCIASIVGIAIAIGIGRRRQA